jgi:Fe2+ transport system protein FeoA
MSLNNIFSFYKGLNMLSKNENSDETLFLSQANVGESFSVEKLVGGCAFQQRLMGMGICSGTRLKLLKKVSNCSMLVGIDGSRFALGGGMANKIMVKKIDT